MAENVRRIDATPEQVFAVLADGWLYPSWVVGASRIRGVHETWPGEGAELHHSFGVWPVLINDKTVLLEWDPPRRAVLRAHGWPIGEAQVTDVTKAGAALVLRYVAEVQGTQVPVSISLVPDGETLKADFVFMGGEYAASSVAKRKK